ncbi:MAG: type II secretion system F family protein [Actinomycetes bacterium]
MDRLGSTGSVEQFRVEQLVWACAAVAAAVVLLIVRTARSGFPGVVASVLLLALAALAGVLARDRRLSSDVARREQRMRSEFPTIAELLALSVSAGEGAAAALERVSRVAHGELAAELRRALDDVRLGAGLVDALQTVAVRVELPELRRFVDGVVVAVDRGTPLAAVLQAQAADAREAERRALIELGGRKDIAMMVPVVFLVLPLSVVFALFPGFYGISLSSP